ncbi:MAG: RICIN domain-containing protein [Ruminococcus sp.]|nr:RICIN domain-containing protein [Ruminococcus sp.]
MWHFIRNDDSSYTIQNVDSNMYLDVDAGDYINNLIALPNGTNVTTFSKFNGTNNQKFFIYRMFDSYYIKPIGSNRVVDLAQLTEEVAIWDYGQNFDPQKFDILKLDYDNLKIGDTNLDGSVDIRDVTAIQRHIAELETLNEEQLALADTNGDVKSISPTLHTCKCILQNMMLCWVNRKKSKNYTCSESKEKKMI